MADDKVQLEGTVVEVCRGGTFKVKASFGDKEHIILAYPSGKIRKFGIAIVMGDIVSVEVSPYSLDKGRITYRSK